MKNKYQKALINIGTIFIPDECNEDGDVDFLHLRDSNTYGDDYYLLQELVDKATPRKPVGYNYEHDYTYFSYVRHYCPSCENKVEVKNTYCPHCGQALDWSEEND